MTQSQPLVSVLMTCYNREKYISQAIKSVLASTYKNFELIIVDDGSSDETLNIARSFAEKDDRIKIHINENNLGDYPNRNKAAGYATGKYLKYVDSDDSIYPNGLEIMVNSMESFPDAGFGMSSLEQDAARPFPFMLAPKEAYEYHFFGPRLFHKGPLASIITTAAFKAMGGFAPGRMISDTDMWHRMALYYPIVLISEGVVWQRRHADQELSSAEEFIIDREKIKWKYLNDVACKLSKDQVKTIKKRQIKTYITFSLYQFSRFKFRNGFIYLRCLWNVLNVPVKEK